MEMELLPAEAVAGEPAGQALPRKGAAAERISLFPWSAAMCILLSAITIAASVAAPRSVAPAKPSAETLDLGWHARCAMMLLVQSMVLELFILVSSFTAAGTMSDDLKPKEGSALQLSRKERVEGTPPREDIFQHNLADSMIMILEHTLKFITARHFGSAEGPLAWKAPVSPDPSRSVFPVRHLQWAVAVPLLVLISNRAFLAGFCNDVQVLQRSAPAMILTCIYCVASLAMEVTTSVWYRNLLIALVFADFVVVSVDQVVVACQVPGATSRGVKLSMLGFQLFTFVLYPVLYFAAYFGHVSSIQEQSLYTYADASVKILHGCFFALLRNCEDIRVIQHWWEESVAARRDFERLVEQARVPIFGMDLSGRVTTWNGSMAQITGLAPEAVEGELVMRLVHHDCHASLTEAQASAAAAAHNSCSAVELLFRKNPWACEESAPGSKTNYAVLVVSLVKQLSKQGTVEGYVGIGQDITQLSDMKAVEQKKAQLMAVVSHELRSPLHGMIGLTTTMESAVPDEHIQRQIGMVRSCAHRLLDLVTNIMDVTETEQQQQHRKGMGARDKKSLVNLLEVAEEVTVMTMMAVDKAGKYLVSEDVVLKNLLPELEKFPAVLGNPYKLTQLLYNLVTNACKFTRKGSVTLRARHCRETATLEVSVEDTGAGISEDSLDIIFRPFEQGHGSTADARSFQGMGLGLAVCKEVVRLHNGSISVSSELEKGSTFTVSLPCQDTFVERPASSISMEALLAHRARVPAPPGGVGAASGAATAGGTAMAAAGGAVAAGGAAAGGAPNAGNPPKPALAPHQSQSPKAKSTGQLPSYGSRPPLHFQGAAAKATTLGELPSLEEHRRPLVLSVDDDEVNQEVVRHALLHDCDVHSSMDGKQALDFLEARSKQGTQLPDVILLDIQMPGLTGYDVLAEVRQRYSREHSKLPVIMASAKTPVEHTAIKSYAEGCSDYLSKPFHTDVLRAKVMVALEIKREVQQDSRKAATTLDSATKASLDAAKAEAARWEAAAKACQERLDEAQDRADAAKKAAAAVAIGGGTAAQKEAGAPQKRASTAGLKFRGAVAAAAVAQKEARAQEQKASAAEAKAAGTVSQTGARTAAPPKEAGALEQKVVAAEARARSEGNRAQKAESEVAELRQELQAARRGGASSPPRPAHAAGRAGKAERLLSELRQELDRMRPADTAASSTTPTDGSVESPEQPPSPPPAVGGRECALPQLPPALSSLACPVPTPTNPQLYQRLVQREQEIVALRGRLGTEGCARELAVRQWDTAMQLAVARPRGLQGAGGLRAAAGGAGAAGGVGAASPSPLQLPSYVHMRWGVHHRDPFWP